MVILATKKNETQFPRLGIIEFLPALSPLSVFLLGGSLPQSVPDTQGPSVCDSTIHEGPEGRRRQ